MSKFPRKCPAPTWLICISIGLLGNACTPAWRAVYLNPGQIAQLEGKDFKDWSTVLGDGTCNAKGEPPADQNDVGIIHHGEFSTLEANPKGRDIQAHNITYLSVTNHNALGFEHRFRFGFRLPRLPVKNQPATYAQDIEGSIQLWDGSQSRLDLIVAFSWVINPFATPGRLQTWNANNDQGHWQDAGFLALDTKWHEAELRIDPGLKQAEIWIDQQPLHASLATTIRPNDWSGLKTARVTIEGSSVWVCQQGKGVPMRAEYRDWQWKWLPNATYLPK